MQQHLNIAMEIPVHLSILIKNISSSYQTNEIEHEDGRAIACKYIQQVSLGSRQLLLRVGAVDCKRNESENEECMYE
jgi:hypothetical protein